MNALHLLIILVQVLLRAGFTCDKNFEATYFRARKFVPVCVTCASTDNLIGVIIENVQRNGRQEILLPQCQTCIDNPDIRSVVCAHIKSNAIFRGFTPIGNVRQVVPVRNSLPVRPQCPAALHGCNLGPRNEDLPPWCSVRLIFRVKKRKMAMKSKRQFYKSQTSTNSRTWERWNWKSLV